MEEQHIHRFTQATIPLFENCEFCGERIISVFNSAFQCSQCLKYCHKQCCETADSISPCRGQPDSTSNQELLFTAFPVNHSLAENSLNFYENFIKSMAWKKEDDMQPAQNNVSYRVTTPIANSIDDSDDESLQDGTLGSYSSSFSESGNDTIVIPGDHKLSLSLYDDDNGVLSYPGLLTVIVQQATEVPFSNGNGNRNVYVKVSLKPWGNERYKSGVTSLNDGFPDWEGHGNTFSFDYPGALPKVNPLIRITIKPIKTFFSLMRPAIGEVQVPLRKLDIVPNRYHDSWYDVYKDGKKTAGQVRVSFMFSPDMTRTKVLDSNPQKTHYFEKVLNVSAFATDCPVCRKSLISGIVDSIYQCKVCHMYCHGNCRERAKSILKCVPLKKDEDEVKNNEALSDKLLRSIKKDRLLIYDQPIGCLTVFLNQLTLFSLKNKHKSLFLQLSCDQIEQSSPSVSFNSIIDFKSDEFSFSWLIFDPNAVLRITIKDRLSLQPVGFLKISLQEVIFCQGDEEMTTASIYTPLHSSDSSTDVTIRTYDVLHKTSGGLNTIGSISLAIHFLEEPRNLFSKQTPPLPSIPDMTPAVASGLWVRVWQIAKIFLDLFDYAKFAVSWEFPPLSLGVALGYFGCIFLVDTEYIHFYLLLLIVLVLFLTYILRKKHMIAKTIQTNEADKNSSYYQVVDSVLNMVNTPVNQMKNTLSAATLVLFAANLFCTMSEKLYHLFLWTHPAKTRYFMFLCLMLTVFSMVIPVKVILILLGCCFLFPKKVSLGPFLFGIVNFLNSIPDDDQVFNHLCPPSKFTNTFDGIQHEINRGYCREFKHALIADSESSLWRGVYLGFGYDGLVRKWKSESEVKKKKGNLLFHVNSIENVSVEMSFRELSRYGMESDCSWTASNDNILVVKVLGKASPLVFCFETHEEREEVYQLISEFFVC